MTTEAAEAPPEGGQAPAEPAAPPAAAPAGVSELSAGESKSWYGEIEDPELKSWAENKGFADPVTALKSHRSLEGMMGKERLSVPDQDNPAEWDGWSKFGVPEEASGYKDAVKLPELPDGMQMDEAFLEAAFEKGVAAKVPPFQMQQMLDLYAEREMAAFQQVKAVEEKDRAELDALYTEWGGQKEAMLDQSRRAAKFFGLSEDELAQMNGQMGSAKLLQGFQKIGAAMQEGGLVSANNGGVSKEAAQQELTRMKGDADTVAALMDPSNPKHAEMKQKWDSLLDATA